MTAFNTNWQVPLSTMAMAPARLPSGSGSHASAGVTTTSGADSNVEGPAGAPKVAGTTLTLAPPLMEMIFTTADGHTYICIRDGSPSTAVRGRWAVRGSGKQVARLLSIE